MKRNRMQLYLIGLLAGGLLAGCTAGPVEEIVPEESRPVAISFGKPDLGVPELLTRAREGGTPAPTPLPEGATVRIGAYFTGNVGDPSLEASFSTTAPSFEATYVVGADGALTPCCVDENGKKTEGDAKGLTVRGGVYDFYAVSPARPLQKGADNNYKITGIPHKEDVMTSFVRGVAVSKDSRLVTLGTFSRKCAMVVFNVASSPMNVLPFDRLYGTSLVIKKISSSAASLIAGSDTGISPTGGTGGVEAEVAFAAGDFEPVVPESDPNNWGLNKTKGIVLPKNSQSFDVEITVVRDEETATLKATIDKNISFDEGKRYIFTLEVKNNESTLEMKVLDWNAIAFNDPNVGGPDSPYPDPDINEGIGTSITVARWNNIQWTGNGDIGGPEDNGIYATIDQSVLTSYRTKTTDMTMYPPFDADGVKEYHGCTVNETAGTMTGSYTIEVEKGQRAGYDKYATIQSYCTELEKDGGWRIPTMIELHAMYINKAKIEGSTDASTFISNFYWSSSVYNGNSGRRCILNFGSGSFSWRITLNDGYVRCVRDKN